MSPEVEVSVFKRLWKFVFKLDNPDAENNRTVNYWLLEIIYKRQETKCIKCIRDYSEYFSKVSNLEIPIRYLVYFLSLNSDLYECLDDSAKEIVKHAVNKKTESGLYCSLFGWFVFDSLEEYYKSTVDLLSGYGGVIEHSTWMVIKNFSDTEEWQNKFCNLISQHYAVSINYETADNRFRNSVKGILNYYSLEALIFLLNSIVDKPQVWGRNRAIDDHDLIKHRIIELCPDFDFNPYKAVFR